MTEVTGKLKGEVAKKREAYKKWYEKNRKNVALKRKMRYRQDGEYRDKQLEARRQAIAEEKSKRERHIQDNHPFKVSDLESEFNIPEWRVYDWIAQGVIEVTHKYNGVSYFTEKQAELLSDLYEAYQDAGGTLDTESKEVSKALANIKGGWGGSNNS